MVQKKQNKDRRTDSSTNEGKKTRRRGSDLEDAILQATLDELADVGYARLTIEGVADRARTGKAAVYRRWSNRAELVLDAIRKQGPLLGEEVPDTGDLREDILVLLNRFAHRLQKIGADTLNGLFTEYVGHISVNESTTVRERSAKMMMTILKRAAERGEVELDRITPRIATLPNDLIRHELLITREPISDQVIVEIVDDIFLPLITRP
ncbi:TetR/AcrR family transcriptional regulator [Camelliibacillus cellulosilyticus]|uniref:TetR/AcrR family transcriptional regulator n=1 Tax=Camelliibacillus cellulosilyticus TaxID=2174486 RepID=A0ABV9GMZ2_9BACL